MKKHMAIFLLAVLVFMILLAYTVAYQVDFTEYSLINRFGKTVRSLDGSTQAGLHFKWPYPVEKLIKYDARTFVFEDTHSELSTRDKQNVLITLYCAWKISDPALFHSRIEYVDAAQERLRTLLRNYKKEVINQRDMSQLINADPKGMRLEEIERNIMTLIQDEASKSYGIQIVNVGVKRLGLPENVSSAVIDAMKEERQRYVRRYEAQGEAQATAITERAKADSAQIIAFANRQAQNIRSEGDRAAAEYYAMFNENPGLSMFLRSLESLKKELAGRTVMILDGSELPAVKFFREGPSLVEMKPPAAQPASK